MAAGSKLSVRRAGSFSFVLADHARAGGSSGYSCSIFLTDVRTIRGSREPMKGLPATRCYFRDTNSEGIANRQPQQVANRSPQLRVLVGPPGRAGWYAVPGINRALCPLAGGVLVILFDPCHPSAAHPRHPHFPEGAVFAVHYLQSSESNLFFATRFGPKAAESPPISGKSRVAPT